MTFYKFFVASLSEFGLVTHTVKFKTVLMNLALSNWMLWVQQKIFLQQKRGNFFSSLAL